MSEVAVKPLVKALCDIHQELLAAHKEGWIDPRQYWDWAETILKAATALDHIKRTSAPSVPPDIQGEPRDIEKPMLVFQYRNWRDEVAERHVIPQRVWWGSTEFHPIGCWLLTAYDLDRQAMRDFDIRGINAPELFGKIEDRIPTAPAPDAAVEAGGSRGSMHDGIDAAAKVQEAFAILDTGAPYSAREHNARMALAVALNRDLSEVRAALSSPSTTRREQ